MGKLEDFAGKSLGVPTVMNAEDMNPMDYARRSNAIFIRNQQYAKPGPYKTKLSAQDEIKYQDWMSRFSNSVRPLDPNDHSYDMRGYWSNNRDAAEQMLSGPSGAHFPDTYKTPYHPTFSNESKYATPDAPSWNSKDQLIDQHGNIVFDPTWKGNE